MKVPNSVPRFFAEAARKHCVSSAQWDEMKTEWYPFPPPSTHGRKKQKKKKKKKKKKKQKGRRAEGRVSGAKGRRKVFKARPRNMAGGKPRKLSARFA